MENNNTVSVNAKDLVLGWMDDSLYHTYHINFAKLLGLNESIILSKLVNLYNYWNNRGQLDHEDMFFCAIEDMYELTAIARGQQSRAVTNLVNMGLITSKRKGLPAKRYFSLNFVEIALKMQECNKKAQNEQSDSDAVSETSNPQEPHNDGKAQNEQTRKPKTSFTKSSKRADIKESELKDLELKDLEEEEEEEEARGSELFEFLVSKGHEPSDVKIFENKIEELQITGYTNEQANEAIILSLKDLKRGKCHSPYSFAGKKLDYVMKGDKAEQQTKPKQKPRKTTREESVPEWFEQSQKEQREQEEKEQAEREAKEQQTKEETDKRRLELLAKLEKMGKEGQK